MKKGKIVSTLVLCILFITATCWPARAKPGDQVRVTIKLLHQNGNPVLIPFDLGVPLKISDFLGKPDLLSHGVAATRSGIAMNTSGSKQNNQVLIEVDLFVYFDKNKSWIKKEGRNNRILNHEQHHFDITAIQLCKFVREIKTYPFSVADWKTELNDLYKKNMKELQNLQNKYDRETAHGTKPDAQIHYDQKITIELRKQGCFTK
jgi:hypothetical protein